jgi:hypothetical protein
VINTLDKRDGKPAVIHHPHPDRIAWAFAGTPLGGLAVVNPSASASSSAGASRLWISVFSSVDR